MDEEKINKINLALKEWFEQEGKTETTPNEIISFLVDKGIYTENAKKDGSRLRGYLRDLNKINKLDLIDGVYFIQKKENKNWYFKKV